MNTDDIISGKNTARKHNQTQWSVYYRRLMNSMHVSPMIQRLMALLVVIVSVVSLCSPAVYAMNGQQRLLFDQNVLYFNYKDQLVGNCGATSGDAILVGGDNIAKAFNFLTAPGRLSAPQAAGLLGNLVVEDPGLVPDRVQGGGTAPAPVAGKGYGIAQWTSSDRQTGLVTVAAQHNLPPSDLGAQLLWLWQELNTSYAKALQALKAATDPRAASDIILVQYEAPADHAPGGPNSVKRGDNAAQILKQYGGGSTSNGSPDSTTAGICTSAVQCSTPGSVTGSDTTTAQSGLSPIRQNAVCLAQQELTAWKQPGVIPKELCKRYGADKGANAPWCEEWCADFVSWIYDQSKYPLKPDPNWRVPAVAQIQAIGQANQNFHYHPSAGYTPKPGDMAIHIGPGVSHVNMVVAVSGNTITLIGGDQGSGPYGGPNSNSVVSQVTQNSPSADSTVGYVGPD